MPKLIILRGYPGSGKTTIGKELEKRGAGQFIDHNAILTFVAGIAGNDDGIYDEIAQLEQAICRKLLSEGKQVIVARGFSKRESIDEYVQIAKELGVDSLVARLNVSELELMKRVKSPERKLDFNPTIDEATAKSWMSENPIEEYPGEIVVDNQSPVDEVVTSITREVISRK